MGIDPQDHKMEGAMTMQNSKKWLFAMLSMAVLAGVAFTIDVGASRSVEAQDHGPGDHWRNYQGHWSYWHAGDRRWYYTDGRHWFYNDGRNWNLYRFDR